MNIANPCMPTTTPCPCCQPASGSYYYFHTRWGSRHQVLSHSIQEAVNGFASEGCDSLFYVTPANEVVLIASQCPNSSAVCSTLGQMLSDARKRFSAN